MQKVKIKKISASGTSYYINCPKCNKFIVLGSELITGHGICNKCYTRFLIDIK